MFRITRVNRVVRHTKYATNGFLRNNNNIAIYATGADSLNSASEIQEAIKTIREPGAARAIGIINYKL